MKVLGEASPQLLYLPLMPMPGTNNVSLQEGLILQLLHLGWMGGIVDLQGWVLLPLNPLL
jgi:hypothetical protein